MRSGGEKGEEGDKGEKRGTGGDHKLVTSVDNL